MPKRVSGTPNRQPHKPKRRAPGPAASPSTAPIRQAAPVERPRAEVTTRASGPRVRAQSAPVVDYHYVIEDLRRVGLLAVAMFAVLGVLAVLLR